MDLYIDREELIRALARVQGIVERRTTNLALAHVLLSAKDNTLRMTATDTMVALIADYTCRVETEGELSVDAQSFYQVARSLPESTVHLTKTEGGRIAIECGRARFHLVSMDAEEFPPLPSRDDKATLNLPGVGLRRLIEETIFSISPDDNRYGLNGAHLEDTTADDGAARLRVVTTDGSRLSWSEATYEGEFNMGGRMLLPRKALLEVRRLCNADDVAWTVGFGDRSAVFATSDVTLMTRLVDGEFPDYRQVVPAEGSRQVVVNRSSLVDALKRVAIVASDRNHSVRFCFEADRMLLQAENVDLGDAHEEVPAELQGDPMTTGFNVRYFQDILSATEGDRLRFDMGEPLDPCVVRIVDRQDCRFVVMPMRLD